MFLILSYGNSLRQDDGAGLAVGSILESIWQERGTPVRLLALHQLTPDIAVAVSEPEVSAVVFADTRVASHPSDIHVEVRRIAASDIAGPLGHHMTPGVLLAIAAHLYDKEPPAWLVTVPGIAFDHGEEFSPLTREALTRAEAFFRTLQDDWPLSAESLELPQH
ncbi:MAG: hydrogenase [Syntrophobacteraceae bacterium]